MNLNGAPAPNPPPDRGPLTRVTLASCREGLRAAIRLLSLSPQSTPSAGDSSEGSPHGDDTRDLSSDAAILQNFQKAEQAYDDLVTNISHDVKTSLTVIRGHAQMTARAIRRGDAIDPDALLATLQVIDTSAVRISSEIDGWTQDAGAEPA